ncbi:MAG: leucine--tRNA ligase [Leptospiraceae bacterium]|nr:leucine--tRNA ligase [Leptospiraceae bacterium]MDW8306237.1 leucine--tRNA ligase [Leptospiraceae bacterium]
MGYPFAEIELKWQAYWKKHKTFKTEEDYTKPKFYVLDMFPYPSAAGLHVGHPEGYTATDIVARYMRMRGYNVLHPMGWDAFGLPAERYAMQTKIHPAITTEKNIANFKRQLERLGFAYDWDREINTTDPKYYKWTQWIFLKIFNSWYDPVLKKARPIEELPIPEGLSPQERKQYIDNHRLAYVADVPVNWCPELGTVLANEEVDEWVAKGYSVERRPMRQWLLRITAYAERLIEDLKEVDWPSGTLELQKNWIGKSEGAEIDFELEDSPKKLKVFTTRPDTLFGVTFMVLAPEHPLVPEITKEAYLTEVQNYVQKAKEKSDLERQLQAAREEKSGVFTGSYAIHPITSKKLPIFISDYVLITYGTGAIMAVPAHDERDFAFAQKYSLEMISVVKGGKEGECYSGEGIAQNSQFLDGLTTREAKEKIILWLEENGKGRRQVRYKLRDWVFSRQRYWGEPIPISYDENGDFVAEEESNLPLELPPCEDFMPAATGESPLANLKEWVYYEKNGKKLKRETNTMPQWAGSSWYYLRYCDPHNEKKLIDPEKERYWLHNGVDLYVGGSEHAVLHLLYARFWHKVLYDLGYVTSKEPFRKLVHQGLILGEDGQKMSKSRGNVVNPDEVVEKYGADSFRLFEMFMGPLEQIKPWSSKGIEGVHRFLSRLWRLFIDKDGQFLPTWKNGPSARNEKILHETIKKVTEDIERLAFNTAIAQMMIFVNEVVPEEGLGEEGVKAFVKLLSPFAPHLAEELWEKAGYAPSVANERWPQYDPTKILEQEVEIIFQVNGKLRSKAVLPKGLNQEELLQKAKEDEVLQRHLKGREIKRIIFVQDKLLNFVV